MYIWTSCRTGQVAAQHTHQPSGFCVVCLTSSSRSAAKPPSPTRHARRAEEGMTGLAWAAPRSSPAASAQSGCRGCRWPWPSPRPGGKRAGAWSRSGLRLDLEAHGPEARQVIVGQIRRLEEVFRLGIAGQRQNNWRCKVPRELPCS